MESQILIVLSLIIYMIGGVWGLLAGVAESRHGKARVSHRMIAVGYVTAIAGAVAGVLGALAVLYGGQGWTVSLWALGPFGVVSARLDSLSAFFLFILNLVAIAVAVYAIGFIQKEPSPGWQTGMFNFFLVTLSGVFLADHVILFLLAWEGMSLISTGLVLTRHQESSVRRAGFVYLVMTHLGTGFVVTFFFYLAGKAGSFGFTELARVASGLEGPVAFLMFLCAFIGFGTKAGLVPLHVWLPRAHPAAPAHVSAMMSGLMVKTAVYAMVRVFFDYFPHAPGSWGAIVLAAGTMSGVIGVFLALLERDLKRLLAFSTVENVGIIMMGAGAGMLARAFGFPQIAAFALTASLFHVLNHALFKALLFLAAGAVYQTTHSKDMECLGGLIRTMPWTGAAFFVGAMAASGLPLLNGFASEWLTFQSLFNLALASGGATRVGTLMAAAFLGLTGALAAACFVKAFGITFLALPRSKAAAEAQETGALLRAGMVVLAGLCFGFGLFPGMGIRLITSVAGGLVHVSVPLGVSEWGIGVLFQGFIVQDGLPGMQSDGIQTNIQLLWIGILLVFTWVGLWVLLGRGKKLLRIEETWNCGVPVEPVMEYNATAFATPLRLALNFLGRVSYEARFYRPISDGILSLSRRSRRIQGGNIHVYLSYIFGTLVILLLLGR